MATTLRMTTPRRAAGRRIDPFLFAAPVAAVAAGMGAEWLDFRALRYPLLLMMGLGVVVTGYALVGDRTGWKAAVKTVVLGVSAWAAAQTFYVVLHLALGGRLNFEMFDSQPAQAAGLIVAHGVFLGAPTGGVAAAGLWLMARMRRP